MKKLTFIFLILFSFSLNSYSEINIDFFDNSQYLQNQNPNEWTYELQKATYLYFFTKKDFNQIGRFYNFIKTQGSTKLDGDMEFANPIIIALTDYRYNKYLKELYEVIPEAFSLSANNGNTLSEAPIIFAIRTNILDNVKFFFENNIPIKMTEDLFGSFDRGGSRFKFGFNLLTAIDNPNGQHIHNYLVSRGYEEESKPFKSDYYLYCPESVYSAPGFKSKYTDKIDTRTKLKVEKYTNYKKDGSQWVKIVYDKNKTGWIPDTFLYPETRKGEGI